MTDAPLRKPSCVTPPRPLTHPVGRRCHGPSLLPTMQPVAARAARRSRGGPRRSHSWQHSWGGCGWVGGGRAADQQMVPSPTRVAPWGRWRRRAGEGRKRPPAGGATTADGRAYGHRSMRCCTSRWHVALPAYHPAFFPRNLSQTNDRRRPFLNAWSRTFGSWPCMPTPPSPGCIVPSWHVSPARDCNLPQAGRECGM